MDSLTFKTRLFTYRALALATAGIIVFSSPAFAHERHYAFNTEYRTIPQGEFEIEQSVTSKVPHWDISNENSFQYQTELEYGVTDKWTIAHYEHWDTENHAGYDDDGRAIKDVTKYSGFNFETKYRFGEKGQYWIDPLIYFEISHDPRKAHEPVVLEEKIVLSKDFNKLNFTYNQIMESVANRGGRTEHEFTFATSYELPAGFRAGIEIKGQYWNPEGHHNELAMGPTLAWGGKYFWVTAGALFGLNRAQDDTQARVIIGVPIG